jgi:3-oxoacyl-[acyl-carrier-protein] synthase II
MIKNSTKRVVVTGMGLATAFGDDLNYVWNKLINGSSAIRRIESFDSSMLGCQIAAEIQFGEEEGQIDINKYLDVKDQKRYGRFIQLGIVAASQAMEHSGLNHYFWKRKKDHEAPNCKKVYHESYDDLMESSGVIIGSGIGGLPLIEKSVLEIAAEKLKNKEKGIVRNPLRDPFFIVGSLINSVSGFVSTKFGLKGPNQSAVTACATGAHAIADAARIISTGAATIMLAGGSEATICETAVAGFDVMRALSRKNDNPESASCPWDKERDGFVMGEGAGILVLEEYDHAMRRGAKIYGEIVGFGTSGDAYHMSAPHPEGDGGMRAMKMALKSAGVDITEIDYINAHGTSTPLGDLIELRAIKRLYNENLNSLKNLSISSTKSMIGHLLGAAGSVEAIFALMAMDKGEIPPTINLNDPDEFKDNENDENEIAKKVTDVFNLTPNVMERKNVRIAVSNSFGFGGTNSCLVFKKI